MDDKACRHDSPGHFIRDRRKVLEGKIRQAVQEFQDEVCLNVTGVEVGFAYTHSIGGKQETHVTGVKVTLEAL